MGWSTLGAFAYSDWFGIKIPIGAALGLGPLGPLGIGHRRIGRGPVVIPQLCFILLLAVAVGDPRKRMENFSAAVSLITAGAEMFRQRHRLFQPRTASPILSIVVDP